MNHIPEYGRPYEEISKDLDAFAAEDPAYKDSKTWSLVYYKDEDYTHFLAESYEKFFSANGLNPTAFKSLKRFENDIVAFTAELLHGDEHCAGCVTSCGTESCMLAVKTYRDRGKAVKGIRHPEMIVAETAHVAWFKGAEYFGVKVHTVPVDKDWKIDIKAVQKKINRNTVLLLGSAPEYPHGMIDDIAALGALGEKHGIPVHVDACVGGYLLPFMEQAGITLPPYDFRVNGVTSVSADIHKYGFAAKGCSCILYKNLELFKYQCYVHPDWPGGLFASPAFLGTRPGGAYAAAWAAIQANGRQGYIAMAKQTVENAERIKEGIRAIDELEIIGNPQCSLVAYRAKNPYEVSIFAVGDKMQEKGWHIDRLLHPDGLHAMITCSHTDVIDAYLRDLREAVEAVKGKPTLAMQGEAATYSTVGHIPLKGVVRNTVLNTFAQSYEVSQGLIDIASSAAITGNERADALIEKLILKDIKTPGFAKKLLNGVKAAGGIGISAIAATVAGTIVKTITKNKR